jgi:hypothetical protein
MTPVSPESINDWVFKSYRGVDQFGFIPALPPEATFVEGSNDSRATLVIGGVVIKITFGNRAALIKRDRTAQSPTTNQV